ncbi:MAG TPA: prepilin-type N-terminal cleavage/methylation domain-containing protein [Thermoleophilaceae bacterium]
MSLHSLRSDERGFTLVELMAAIIVLLAGVLGAVALIDGANAGTTTASDRVGAVNLARELTEGARAADYNKLDPANIVDELRNQPQLAGSYSGSWTLNRRGVTYTVTTDVCTYDDKKDGIATTPPANVCANEPTSSTTDSNGDDFRRITFTVAWILNTKTRSVQQTTLIPNPSGGLGPRVVSLSETLVAIPPGDAGTTCPSTPPSASVSINAVTTPAASLHWTTDNAGSEGDATSADGRNWPINWNLDSPLVLDGTYTLTAQAFDDRGIPGDVKAATVALNRSCPQQPSGFQGGFNHRSTTGHDNGVLEFQWDANQERDIVGYRVYWAGPDGAQGGGNDVQICPASGTTPIPTTSCYADRPAGAGTSATYYVVAVDLRDIMNPQSPPRQGDPRMLAMTDPGDPRPTWPDGTTLTATLDGGYPTLTWDQAASPATGHTIRFYRIYRDGDPSSLSNRNNWVGFSSSTPPFVWPDPSPGSTTSHQYWVTAVDDQFNESDPVGPVTSP